MRVETNVLISLASQMASKRPLNPLGSIKWEDWADILVLSSVNHLWFWVISLTAPGPEEKAYPSAIKRHRSPPRFLGQSLTSILIQNREPQIHFKCSSGKVLGTSQITKSRPLSSSNLKQPAQNADRYNHASNATVIHALPYSKMDLKLVLS